MYSRSCFFKNSQLKRRSIHSGCNSKEVFHPRDIVAYLAGDRTLQNGENGLLNVELHMGGYGRDEINFSYEMKILKHCQKQQLPSFIGIGLKYPELFEIAKQYRQLDTKIKAVPILE